MNGFKPIMRLSIGVWRQPALRRSLPGHWIERYLQLSWAYAGKVTPR